MKTPALDTLARAAQETLALKERYEAEKQTVRMLTILLAARQVAGGTPIEYDIKGRHREVFAEKYEKGEIAIAYGGGLINVIDSKTCGALK